MKFKQIVGNLRVMKVCLYTGWISERLGIERYIGFLSVQLFTSAKAASIYSWLNLSANFSKKL